MNCDSGSEPKVCILNAVSDKVEYFSVSTRNVDQSSNVKGYRLRQINNRYLFGRALVEQYLWRL